jgi:chain length determinant protein (polysaccharide antigen chain regulator)
MTEQITTRPEYDDEIDLIEPCKNLWAERITILVCTMIVTAAAVTYLFLAKPVYTAGVELTLPSADRLRVIKPIFPNTQEDLFLYTPDAPLRQQQELLSLLQEAGNKKQPSSDNDNFENNDTFSSRFAFSLFLNRLESSSQINELINTHPELLTEALTVDINTDNSIPNIQKMRTVEYPNTQKKNNALQPDSYTFTYEGYNRNALKTLISHDIKITAVSTNQLIKRSYLGQLDQLYKETEKKQLAKLASLDKRINARQWYLQRNHAANIALKEEELAIAKAINDQAAVAKLVATLQNLKQRNENTFYDEDLLAMQAQQRIIANNSTLQQIGNEIERIKNEPLDISYSNDIVITPTAPIKPRKMLILAIGIILGGMLGLFVAIGRITVRNAAKRASA